MYASGLIDKKEGPEQATKLKTKTCRLQLLENQFVHGYSCENWQRYRVLPLLVYIYLVVYSLAL